MRAGGGLEEEIDLGPAAKARLALLDLAAHLDLFVGQIEKRLNVQRRQPLDAEEMPVGENGSGGVSHLKAMAIGAPANGGKQALYARCHSTLE